MWNSAGEIPQIVFLHISNKAPAVPINGRDPRRPIEHDRPFVRRVPVQFTNAPGCESHVYACQGLRDRRSEEHTSELQSHLNLVCRLLLEKKKNNIKIM